MVDLENFLASKFDIASVKSEYSIMLDNFSSKSSCVIMGDKLDLELLKEKINELIASEDTKIIILEIDLDSESHLAKIRSSIISGLQKKYRLIFTSKSYLKLVDVFGTEFLRSHFNHLYLAKVLNADIRHKLNNQYKIECMFQRPIIDWAYKKMLKGEHSQACDVLLLYLELYGPRELPYLDRMQYISKEKQTSLPSGDIASILNSGAKIDISWFFYKDAVTQEMERENSKLKLPFWNMQGSPDKKIVFRRVHSPTDEILYASIFKG